MTRKKYQVLSPDGFTIERGVNTYPSKKKSIEAFERFKKNYAHQGYYSSTDYGRIPLNELEDYCQVITL